MNRPSESSDSVAAACATIAGWYRTVGHVTPVASPIESVPAAIAPSTDHAKGECPCESSHGWKWSLISTKSNPDASASCAWRTSSFGPNPSAESLYPYCMVCPPSTPATLRGQGTRGYPVDRRHGCVENRGLRAARRSYGFATVGATGTSSFVGFAHITMSTMSPAIGRRIQKRFAQL